MSAIYDERKDDDGFLYVTYSGENTFGYTLQFPSVSSYLLLSSPVYATH